MKTVTIENEILRVEMDAERPVIRSYYHKPTGVSIQGCRQAEVEPVPSWSDYTARLNGLQLSVIATADADAITYELTWRREVDTFLRVRSLFRLKDNTVEWTMRVLTEPESMPLHLLELNALSLFSATAKDYAGKAEPVLHIGGRLHPLSSAQERIYDYALGCLSVDGVLITAWNNQPTPGGPLFAEVRSDADEREVRGWSHFFYHRVRDEVQPDFFCRIAILTDTNGDGVADWHEGAAWWHEQLPCRILPRYRNAHLGKMFCADPPDKVFCTFDQCLERVRELYDLTNGARQILYLVGWQYDGHDNKYPSLEVVNHRLGGRAKILELMREARRYNTVISFHFNFDNAYLNSPDWDPAIICRDERGEIQKGGSWGGQQSYVLCPYKDVKTGSALRRIERMVELYPLEESIHLDVMSGVPWRGSHDSTDPSGWPENLILGKFKEVEKFNQVGLDVTSENLSYPFCGPMSYFFHNWQLKVEDNPFYAAVFHGKTLYGGWNYGLGIESTEWIPEYLLWGMMVDRDYIGATPAETIAEVFFLLHHVQWLYQDQPITDWKQTGDVIEVCYAPGTKVRWNQATAEYEVQVNGLLVARNFQSLAPAGGGVYAAYSRDDAEFRFPLPPQHASGKFQLLAADKQGRRTPTPFEIKDGHSSSKLKDIRHTFWRLNAGG